MVLSGGGTSEIPSPHSVTWEDIPWLSDESRLVVKLFPNAFIFSELILHLVLFFSELLPFVTVVKGNTCNSNTITLITVHSTLFLVISWPLDDSVKGSNSCQSCINLDDKFPGFFFQAFQHLKLFYSRSLIKHKYTYQYIIYNVHVKIDDIW